MKNPEGSNSKVVPKIAINWFLNVFDMFLIIPTPNDWGHSKGPHMTWFVVFLTLEMVA